MLAQSSLVASRARARRVRRKRVFERRVTEQLAVQGLGERDRAGHRKQETRRDDRLDTGPVQRLRGAVEEATGVGALARRQHQEAHRAAEWGQELPQPPGHDDRVRAGRLAVQGQAVDIAIGGAVAQEVERDHRPADANPFVESIDDAPDRGVVDDVAIDVEVETRFAGRRFDGADMLAGRHRAAGGRPGDQDAAALGNRGRCGGGIGPFVAHQQTGNFAHALPGAFQGEELPGQRVQLGGCREHGQLDRARLPDGVDDVARRGSPAGGLEEGAQLASDPRHAGRIGAGLSERVKVVEKLLAPVEFDVFPSSGRRPQSVALQPELRGVGVLGIAGAGKLQNDGQCRQRHWRRVYQRRTDIDRSGANNMRAR